MTQVRTGAAPAAPVATQGRPALEAGQVVDPQATYDALVAQQREFRNQVSSLENRRLNVQRQLQNAGAGSTNRAGLEERLNALDKQIVAGYDRLATADAAVARAVGVPGVAPPPPPDVPNNGPSDAAAAISVVFTLAVLLPISLAFARRIWRRSSAAVTALPGELMERLTRLEESVDAVAIEVERVGEGQRFVTNLFIEGGAPQMLGAGAMAPIEAKQRERVEQERRL
jgi:hypothetical protein